MSNFPKCCTFVRSLYGRLNHTFQSSSMDNVHGRLHYSPSIDNIHGRPYYRPSKTLPIVYYILAKETFLVSLVMIPYLVRSLGPGWSLWTNWRSVFRYPISCPFIQKVVQDIDVIYSLFTWVSVSHVLQNHWLTFCIHLVFQRKCHMSTSEWRASFR